MNTTLDNLEAELAKLGVTGPPLTSTSRQRAALYKMGLTHRWVHRHARTFEAADRAIKAAIGMNSRPAVKVHFLDGGEQSY